VKPASATQETVLAGSHVPREYDFIAIMAAMFSGVQWEVREVRNCSGGMGKCPEEGW